MLAQFIIAFREGFEASLLVAIVSSYLDRIGRSSMKKPLITSALIGIILSIATGAVAYLTYGFLFDKELMEAAGAFIAVPVLTSVIYWMATKGKNIKDEVEYKTRIALEKGSILPIVILGLIFVFREGLETVVFTLPLIFLSVLDTLLGVTMGAVLSALLSYLIYLGSLKISIKKILRNY